MGRFDFEHRTSPRVSLFQEIHCEGEVASAYSQAADISVGGMFIDHPSPPFARLDLVTLRFGLAPNEDPVVVEAAVNYIQEGIGMGVRFLNLDPHDHERVAAFVDRTLHRPVLQGQTHLRKSSRVSISVPVRVRAQHPDGAELDEATQLITLSKHGACVLLSSRMDVGAKMLVETPGGREFRTSVVWVGSDPTRTESQIGIQCRGLAQSLGFRFP
jgi:PilZ domain-containing protein